MTSNHDRFLNAYAKIETDLRRRDRAEERKPLIDVIRSVAAHDSVVRQFRSDLEMYHRLRNAIVHERRDDKPLADPYESTVTDIERISRNLTDPPRIQSHFAMKVATCSPHDMIGDVTRKMLAGNFSQLPVTSDGSVTALLTSKTIARWYGACSEDSIIEDATVEKALEYTEDIRHLAFLRASSSVIKAIDVFGSALEKGYSVDAIVMTHSGQATQSPLGIITPFDIPRLRLHL